MRSSSDTRPLLLAFAFSLLVHALVAVVNIRVSFERAAPPPDAIMVEIFEGEPVPYPEETIEPPPPGTIVSQWAPPAAQDRTPPEPEPLQEAPPRASAQTDSAPPAAEPVPSPSDTQPATPRAQAGQEQAATVLPTEAGGERKTALNKADLYPTGEELALASGKSRPPDPQSDAREVTLSLDAQDARYRGFLDRVQGAVDLRWKWREALLAANRPGTATVRFVIHSGGGGGEAELVESSGSTILDDEALAAVRRAVFPPFPASWTVERLNLVGQFEYRFYNDQD
jgi:protein TonB